MNRLNHLGEPDNRRELPVTAYQLDRKCVDLLRDRRTANYGIGLDYRAALHEHMLKLCNDYSTTLDIIHDQTMLSLKDMVDLTPRQDVRVREAIMNAIVVTATTAEGYADTTKEYAMSTSDREDGLYCAVHDFEDRQRETIDQLWNLVNN